MKLVPGGPQFAIFKIFFVLDLDFTILQSSLCMNKLGIHSHVYDTRIMRETLNTMTTQL